MAKFRLDSIAELTRQMSFTPLDIRATQLDSAEELLHTLDTSKAYPLEFVVYRITGYHPTSFNPELLTGMALQHDIGLLIEQVSDTLSVPTESLSEPVLDIDDVTVRFNVTSKTIQRWRRKGLPGRRFVFPDGKRRVGFLLSSVERFFQSHRDQVSRGTNLSPVDDSEKADILRRAILLASQCRCCVGQITRRIGRKLNRSPATILHILRKHDEEHPTEAILSRAVEPLDDIERLRIQRGIKHGLQIKMLAIRFCRPRSAIYQVVMDERIVQLNSRKIKFIDDELYHHADAERNLDALVNQDELPDSVEQAETRLPRELPAYLQELYRTPLLTASRERALFLKFNYHKYQFVSARRKLEPEFARSHELNRLEGHLKRATEVKNQIVRANLRLVVNIARKHLRGGLGLMELVSEGNITLMRAVEGFDIHRGYRFSTYATLALMKGYARSVSQMLASRTGVGGDTLDLHNIPDRSTSMAADRLIDRDHVTELLSRLNERERLILSSHYGIGNEGIAHRPNPASFDELGIELGLSTQRVRQIEKQAIDKLRAIQS